MKCDVAGCGERPTRLATAGAPAGIAVSGSDVYFTDVAAGAVSKTPIAGGEVSRIGVANDPWGIAVVGPSKTAGADSDAGGRVFWTTNATRGPVMVCPEGGCVGAPVNVAGGDASFAIVSDDANVYWSDWNAIWSCPVEGCSGAPTALAAVSGHVALAVDDANVYWAYADEGVVLSCKKSGCGAIPRSSRPTRGARARSPPMASTSIGSRTQASCAARPRAARTPRRSSPRSTPLEKEAGSPSTPRASTFGAATA